MYKAIIFDCDGVLLDTLEANRHFYNSILAKLGRRRLNAKDLQIVHAMTVKEAFAYLLGPKDAHKAPAMALTLDRGVYISKVKIPAHLKELLAWLKPGYKLGIVTNRDARGVKMLDNFGLLTYFDGIVTSSDVTRPKPAPEGLLKICSLLHVTPAEALYVGDSNSDQKAAADAQMPFAAYANNNLEACWHIADMLELKQVIENLQ